MKESRHANFGAIQAIFLQLSWSQHKLAYSCQGRGQRSNGAINRNKHFARRFCRGISNSVTLSLTVAELFQKEIWEPFMGYALIHIGAYMCQGVLFLQVTGRARPLGQS